MFKGNNFVSDFKKNTLLQIKSGYFSFMFALLDKNISYKCLMFFLLDTYRPDTHFMC